MHTARPIAYLNKKWLCFNGKSYFMMEYISGMHAGDFFAQHPQHEKNAEIIKRIMNLLSNITKLKITHGDLKITNILIDTKEKPILIDLDGAAEHASSSSLHGAWKREIKRFLKNFKDQPELMEKFRAELN